MAMRDWRPLAEQGEAAAQYELGCIYEAGESVPQDYVQAHKWYNIVAVQGFTSAADKRDAIDMKMTSSQIAEAERLACEWWMALGKKLRRRGFTGP